MELDLGALNLKNVLDHSLVGVVIHAWDTSIVYANPRAMDLLEMDYDNLIGLSVHDSHWHFVDEHHRRLMVYEYPVNRVRKSGQKMINEILGKVDDETGDVRWFLVNAYVETQSGASETKGFVVVSFNDVTDRQSLFSYEHILENAGDVVIVTEADSVDGPFGPKIVYVNRAFEQLTGYSREEVIGETPRILQGKMTDEEACRRIREALEKKQGVRETLLNYSKSGRPYWLDMNIMPLYDRNGEITHFAAIERDVTESVFNSQQLERRNTELRQIKDSLNKLVEERTRQLQEANIKLEKLAYYDALTGIPNRRCFVDQLEKLLGFCRRHRYVAMVGILDIDDFKHVNDTHGHAVGDEVLVSLARTLAQHFRVEDIVARLGGEEFAFASVIRDKESSETVCERLLASARKTSIALSGGDSVSITVSIGACCLPPEQVCTIEASLNCADEALYRAKRSGKDRYEVSEAGK